MSNDLDCTRTVLPDVDFGLPSGSRTSPLEDELLSSENSNQSALESINVTNCQVVLDDIFPLGQAEKLKTLKTSLDKNHSATSCQPFEKDYLESLMKKKDPIAWPPMKDPEKWSQLDDDVFSHLVGGSNIFDRVALLETTVYNTASHLFGHLPPPKKGLRGLNRRAQHSIRLVIEKNSLLAQIDSCTEEILRAGLISLLESVRQRLRNFRRGEKNRKKRWKVKHAYQSFLKNPYDAGKMVLDPKCDVKLNCDKSFLDQFKFKNLSDPLRNFPLPQLDGLPPVPECNSPFDNSNLKIEDFVSLLNSRRNGSSPGLNGIPYKVYKKCPKIMSFLFKIFKSCTKLSYVPIQWRVASEVYVPKVNPPVPNKIEDFRPIALLNVEGKLFFSLISKRVENHIIHRNKFIDVSIQKGCMEKVPGCWEHMSLVWNELKESKFKKSCISAVWLDIANAYGSVPHQLVFLALERYGVHPMWIEVFKSYYSGLWSCSFSPRAPSSWHQHFRGIFQGCTASIILFLSAMNIFIEYICADLDPQIIKSSPPAKAFMDDLFLKGSSLVETQNLLNRANNCLNWARMRLKPAKSKSLIMENGRVLQEKVLFVSSGNKDEIIPSIVNNPVKFLGRSISFNLKDTDQIKTFSLAVAKGLSLIDKSPHRGIHKVWILQNLLVPRLRWPLLIYEIPLNIVVRLEQNISSFMRKWLKLHNSTTNICLYSSSSPCPLPLKSLSSVFKSAKVSGHLLLRDSSDKIVAESNVKLKSGNWDVSKSVKAAEETLEFKKILGYHQTNRAGFGSLSIPEIPPKRSHEYRKLVSSIVEESDDNQRQAKAVQLSLQGQWTKWCNFVRFDLSWKTLLGMPQPLISFCLGATYDTLPSPSNLHRWRISTEKSCFLCGKPVCTTAHILGACRKSLEQGRFTFRHDSVLALIVSYLRKFLSTYSLSSEKQNNIHFVKAGTAVTKSMKSPIIGLLNLAPDWTILSDLDSKLVVPHFLAITRLRPDLLLYSQITKTCIIIELTCCCEENIEQWHSEKFFKYDPLSKSIGLNGWKTYLFPIEVGARGYCGTSIKSCFSRLGFSGKYMRSFMKSLSLEALKTSFYIWQNRDNKVWQCPSPQRFECNQNISMQKDNHMGPKPTTRSKKANIPPKVPHSTTSFDQSIPQPNVGLFNKGNTCYINACVQCLSVMPEFWTRVSTGTEELSSFSSSLLKLLSRLKSSKSPIDPSQFLRSLQQMLVKSGRVDFNLYQQQDACEILACMLEELCSKAFIVADLTKIHVKNTVTCNACLEGNITEDPVMILQLPLSESVQTSVDLFLKPEQLIGQNSYFCNICGSLQPGLLEHEFSRVGEFLIIQLKRFLTLPSSITKDSRVTRYDPLLKIPVSVDNDIVSYRSFKLIGSVNHSGNLNQGHYTAEIFDPAIRQWYHCNDKAVVPREKSEANNLGYVLFYKTV